MVRNVVLIKFNDEASDERVAAAEDALGALPGKIEQIRAFKFGRDLRLVPNTFDFAVVSEFDDEAAYRVYAEHPEHQRVINELLRPLIAERAALQYLV